MHKTLTGSLLAALALAAGFITAQAGEPGKTEGCPSAGKGADCKLLKGVGQLKDNDLRFARKGGGVVFVDPTTGPEEAATKTKLLKPDLILITHPHGDHFQPDVLKAYIQANPQVVLAGPAEVVKLAQEKGITGMQTVVPNQAYTLAGFEFSTVPAFFEKKDWNHPPEAQWVGYVLALNGARYYVTGDTQPLPEMASAKADVIFPLLYGCGGNSDQALKMAKISGARVVVPVHHGGQVETIKKYLAQLPPNVQTAYFLDGKMQPAM